MLKIRITKLDSVSWLIAVIVTLNFLSILSGGFSIWAGLIGQVGNALIAVLAYLLIRSPSCDSGNEKKILVCIIVLWVFSILDGLIQGSSSAIKPSMLMLLISNSFMAYIIATRKVSIMPFKVVFYGISIYFIFTCFVRQVSVLSLFKYSAGGMMATIVLCLSVIIYYLEYRDEQSVPVLPCFIVFTLSAISLSRTALISAAILFSGVMFVLTRRSKSKRLGNSLVVVLILTLIYFIYRNWTYIGTMEIYSRFQKEGMNLSGREGIWQLYYNEMNAIKAITGRIIDESHPLGTLYNPHNSFIALHSQVGLLSFCVLFATVKALHKYIRYNYFIAILLITLLVRSFFDTVFFFNNFDFVIYILIFERTLKSERQPETMLISIL